MHSARVVVVASILQRVDFLRLITRGSSCFRSRSTLFHKTEVIAMYATFDRDSPAALDADVLSLSWKGDERRGWLATGNSKKTVGVTYTELTDDEETECENVDISLERQAFRKNFNFREHSKEVTIVRWNNHLDKIATCDASGTVIVWRNHNGRSIMELVNNRGTPISDFQWSNDGNKVLIAYVDGYVLVGTAYGRRIWARQLNLGSFVTNPSNHTTPSRLMSSTWSPDDSRIVVGSSIGELIELDAVHGGTLVSTTEVLPGIGIIGLQWVLVPNKTSEDTTKSTGGLESGHSLASGQIPAVSAANPPQHTNENKDKSGSVRLSLYLRNGKVVLMNSCGDQQATIIRTGLIDGRMLWSSDGAILAVAGFRKSQAMSTVRFFQPTGQLLFTLPLRTKESVTAITWGHNDQKLFVATKTLLHSATISRGIPSLQALCQNLIANTLSSRDESFNLVLPTKLKVAVAESFDPTIQAQVPRDAKLLDYVKRPPEGNTRTYCTVVPNMPSRDSSTASSGNPANQRSSRHPTSYTLYVEHLGTLVPILEAHKRSIKLRQSFTISLPSSATGSNASLQPQTLVLDTTEGDTSMDTGVNAETTTPSQLRLVGHEEAHLSLNTESGVQLACKEDDSESPRHPQPTPQQPQQQQFRDTLSRASCAESSNTHQLAEVTSNMMASKFKIQSLSDKLPADMGSIIIKTSFLHIQPRKVIAYLPHQDLSDSGIDSDASSDESSSEDLLPNDESNCAVDVFMEPDSNTIESLMSMEELQLPLTPETEPLETVRSSMDLSSSVQDKNSRVVSMGPYSLTSTSMKGQRVSMSDSHIQIHSKTPTWNEQHMIYQLDFGGRVTTKSAKNFQLELDSDQVLQFGRIDNGCFILDFQAPFSPIQAFATALANLV